MKELLLQLNPLVMLGALLGCAVTIVIVMWAHNLETKQRLKDLEDIRKGPLL